MYNTEDLKVLKQYLGKSCNSLASFKDLINKIENEDLKEYHYTWKGPEDVLQYNFQGISFDLFNRTMGFYISLDLDPGYTIYQTEFNWSNFEEKLIEVCVETVKYINKVKNEENNNT